MIRARAVAALAVPALIASLLLAPAAQADVVNGNLEQVTGGVPNCFSRAGWGSHKATWELTSSAHSGVVAQSVTVSRYRSGDRKLLISETAACAPAVTPGKTYDLGVWYRSTTAANFLTVFRHSAAGWTYWTDLKQLPATSTWAQATATTPAVPAGTDQIAFGISILGNGTLVTDDYSHAETSAPPPPPPPPPPSNQLTYNGDLELGGGTPDGWFLAGWGDAAVTSGVTDQAHSGSRAYGISLTGRTVGDYKLLPTEARAAVVQPGSAYRLSVWYRSTAAANAITIFAHTAAGWGFYTDLSTLPASAGWTQASVETPPIGAGIDAIAWGVSLAGNGTLVTDDYSTTLAGTDPPPAPGPEQEGRWTENDRDMPVRAVHATLLSNGKVLLIAGSGNDVDQFKAGTFRVSIWDPATNTFRTIPVPKDMFCSGHTTLPDGRLLIQGGTKSYPGTGGGADYGGLKDSYIFDPVTETFTKTNDANEGHWYPTLTELGTGDVWMAGGLKEDTSGAVNTEMWSTQQNQWLPTGQVPQTWSFWGLYPHMFLMSDGRLFYSGGHVFGNGLPGLGASIYDWQTASIVDVPGLREKDMRDQSASVLLPPAQDQKVLIAGGGNINSGIPAISYCDLIDLKEPQPAYRPAPDLPGPGKMYLNATTLPDRTVLTTNGGRLNRDDSANVKTAAIYDPPTNAWRSVAADPIGRNYHSTAVLLADGRVAVFGSNPGDGSYELRVSIYEPPYLFKGTRPQLSGVPAQASYGSQFSFGVQGGSTIRWAQLTRPMSVTHQMDSNMRLVDLPITVTNGVATVAVPTNPNLLPPGPYMLSVTDSNGVPSQSSWVMIR
jgi:Galactose oxidase-like, Early set domain